MTSLIFIKLGGSLITDKSTPNTPRPELISRLAGEIARARTERPDLALLLGHGSGSFGHVPARMHGTRDGVSGPEGWRGFLEVWRAAAALNRIVIEALSASGVPVVNFPPSACATAADGQVVEWPVDPIRSALQAGLVPVVYGDVVFDRVRGGTILSTEDVFEYLAGSLHPTRLLIAGVEPGVWADYPENSRLIDEITPESFDRFSGGIHGSAEVDVTGGMYEKVSGMLSLLQANPGMEAGIFGALEPGNLLAALRGASPGTWLRAE